MVLITDVFYRLNNKRNKFNVNRNSSNMLQKSSHYL